MMVIVIVVSTVSLFLFVLQDGGMFGVTFVFLLIDFSSLTHCVTAAVYVHFSTYLSTIPFFPKQYRTVQCVIQFQRTTYGKIKWIVNRMNKE